MADGPVKSPLPTSVQATPSTLAPRRTRWLWLLLAYASLGIGIVAIFIPGIPTTEFVLLSAWAAGKGSPRLQRWLEQHRLFGPMIHNWRHGRVVARRAKISASLMMSLCLLIMLFTVKRHWVIVLATLGMALGAAWMWSRPERTEDADPGERS
ncbi:YbaN family protein [Herbaspirillum sp. DW155]|uniref:YbaN family protein n=1 Tax=Herbaspirillum sp. DW155 TaxID=3095609 RepID=UPI003092AE0D|nr:YbaN family protein [Herbaspirillum sp. DW155]